MATSVVMPALEMAQETGRLVAWRKREGESVSKGELLMDVETDKAVVEIEAAADGILAGVRVSEGDVVAVGQTIAWIVAPGEAVPEHDQQPASGRRTAGPTQSADQPATPDAVAAAPPVDRPRVSPRARRLAAERGIDLRSLSGSGPSGALRAADVLTAAAPSDEEPGTIWRIMAERMSAAWTTVPHFFLSRDVDASALVALRAQFTGGAPAEPGGGVTYTDLLVALAARALGKHRRVNASWIDGRIRCHDDVHIGVATAVEDGLVVPVIHGASGLSVPEIARLRRELVERARAGRLKPADITGGTFTISNLGMYAVDAFSAIVNAPQGAILAVGRITDRVVAHEGRPAVRPMLMLTLSVDHRVADGARAAAFLADVASAIEHPERVLDDA